MRNWHLKFIIALGVIFTFLYVAFQTFAFECTDGYWKEGNCYTKNGYFSFHMENECSQQKTWKEDFATQDKIRGDINDVKQQIANKKKELEALERVKTELYSKLVNVPVINYSYEVCKLVEKWEFTWNILPKTGADIF